MGGGRSDGQMTAWIGRGSVEPMAMLKVQSSLETPLADGTKISLVLMEDDEGWQFAWWREGRRGDAEGFCETSLGSREEAHKAALLDAAAQLKRL